MTPDLASWQRLGELLVARRVALGYNRRAAFARASNLPNDRILFDLENAKRSNYDAATYAVVEQAYGWKTGSVRRVLAGGDPDVIGGEQSITDDTSSVRGLSVVPTIVEPVLVEEDDNDVLAAIRRDPDLDEPSRMHFLNQYELLRELSLRKKAAVESGHPELLPYVAHGKRTEPVDLEEERRIEEMAREAARNNPHSPYRDK